MSIFAPIRIIYWKEKGSRARMSFRDSTHWIPDFPEGAGKFDEEVEYP